MKKRFFSSFLAVALCLFLLPTVAMAKESPATENVYAILYDDGEVVFQVGGETDSNRTLIDSWPVNMNRDSSRDGLPAWTSGSNSNKNSIVSGTFLDKIKPLSTDSWLRGLTNLTTINGIENLDTSAVTNMRYMFCGCGSLTSLDLSHFDTSNVTDMEGMFISCVGLTHLDLSGFNTSKLTQMAGMFSGCKGLKSVKLGMAENFV